MWAYVFKFKAGGGKIDQVDFKSCNESIPDSMGGMLEKHQSYNGSPLFSLFHTPIRICPKFRKDCIGRRRFVKFGLDEVLHVF